MISRIGPAALAALAGCGTRSDLSVREVDPPLVCDGGLTTVRIEGTAFGATVEDPDGTPRFATARVTLVRRSSPTGEPVAPRTLVVPPDATRWIDGTALEVDVGPEIGLLPGAWDVTVTNPDGRVATASSALVALGAPVVDEVRPDAVCEDDPAVWLQVAGDGFLRLDGAAPEVRIGGAPVPVASTADCAPLVNGAGELCRSVTVAADGTAHPLGAVGIEVVNPSPASCPGAAATIEVVRPAEVDAIEPDATCARSGRFTIRGVGFTEGTGVVVGGVPADVAWIDETTLDVVLGAGTPLGVQDVWVEVSAGCPQEVPEGLRVMSEADVFFVDPPVVYDGIDVTVTAWMSDAGGAVTGVRLVAPDGAEIPLSYADLGGGAVQATVPSGLAAGSYGLEVDREDGCGGGLADALVVSDELTVAVDRVEPAHAWTWDHTPIEIFAEDPPPSGAVAFADAPRVYLTPRDGGSTAATVWGVTWRDPSRVTAVVPFGLEPGRYDVLVVNPDGAVGLLEAGVIVTEEPPPEIASVTPPSLPNSEDATVVIRGREFRDPSVQVRCDEAGSETALPAAVTRWTGTTIEAIVPSTAFNRAICLVEVTNDDGTSARYASLSIRNPAENLFPWSYGTDLVEPRRAPAAAAGRTTSVSRWVYAIGGDDGATATAKTSVERAPVGVYGEMGAWEVLPVALPEPRTLAGAARIGSFVYVIGGSDGVVPVATVLRAHLLDPEDAPHLDRLYLDEGDGLAAGQWVWRVAALYDAADPTNPGGESLPSEPIVVSLASAARVSLTWTTVPRAVGYRVYRTPAAGAPADAVEWLADVGDTAIADDGGATTPERRPLEEGALGQWAAMPVMHTERQSPCVAIAPAPQPDPPKVWLYVAGGLDATGRPLDTIEYLDVTLVADDVQRVGTWTTSANALTEARYECGGYAVDSALHSVVADGESWVYFAGGRTGSLTTGAAEAGRVTAGGDLDPFLAIEDMTPTRAGFGVASASDFLYAFGGHKGTPSKTAASSELEALTMPDLWNWNALGNGTPRPRYLMGSAQESSVLFVVGGTTDGVTATATTDTTHY